MEKKNNNKKIMALLGIVAFLLVIVGASFAYFQAQGGNESNAKIDAITSTTDLLNFKVSNPINISVGQGDFGKGMPSVSGETTAQAILTASNSKNIESTSDSYNIYFVIEENNFIYTTESATPELMLEVTDPNGNKVENITGLTHTENGFDITTRTGSFLLIPDYDISADRGKTTTQDWKVKVTLVNLDTDQSKNMGKTLSGKLYVTKTKMNGYELAKINNATTTTTYNSITTNLNITPGTTEIDKYYFASSLASDNVDVNDLEFKESTEATYKFTGLEANKTYKIYSYAKDKNGFKSNIYETEITTAEYVLPTVDTVTHTSTLNSITLNVVASKGSNDVVKYFYSKDNGETYEESKEATYTFNNLTDTTEYKVKVKVQDTDGKYSTEYYETISTVTYNLPSVTSVTPTTKYNQISLTVTGAKGTNEVARYYYSINNGEYVEDTATHTFTGLSEKTAYTIKVKVADTQGRESNVYETEITTDAYVLPTITNVTATTTGTSITLNVTGQNGDGTITEYYYSKDDGSNYIKGTGISHTFNNLTPITTFYIKVYVKDSNGRESTVYSTTAKTTKLAVNEVCTNNQNLALCIKAYGDTGSSNSNVYIHNASLPNGAGDDSYRFSGVSEEVNNFVCFGYDSTDGTCPTDYLYRIIGVFGNNVKLIKYDYAKTTLLGTGGDYYNTYKGAGYSGTNKGTNTLEEIGAYYWNYNGTSKTGDYQYGSNTWSTSLLNTTNLNSNFTTKLGTTWSNKIATTTWKVGGNTWTNIGGTTVSTAYTNEITTPATNTTVNAKVGLMYVSDYGYAAAPSAWTTNLNSYNGAAVTAVNWMYMGLYEWTIAPRSSYTSSVFRVHSTGNVLSTGANDSYAMRPVLALESSVTYAGGAGTQDSPIIIN